MKEGRQMIVYSGIKNDFLHAVEMDSIAQEIEETIYTKMHRKTARNEFRSWENSLEYMYKVLMIRQYQKILVLLLSIISLKHLRE